jgi:hyperosmotically inducible protein
MSHKMLSVVLLGALAAVPAISFANTGHSETAAQSMRDIDITAKVKSAFVMEKGLKSTDISVTTKDGVVTLTGTTDSQKGIDMAGEKAKSIEGVKSVDNKLTVKK